MHDHHGAEQLRADSPPEQLRNASIASLFGLLLPLFVEKVLQSYAGSGGSSHGHWSCNERPRDGPSHHPSHHQRHGGTSVAVRGPLRGATPSPPTTVQRLPPQLYLPATFSRTAVVLVLLMALHNSLEGAAIGFTIRRSSLRRSVAPTDPQILDGVVVGVIEVRRIERESQQAEVAIVVVISPPLRYEVLS